MGNQPPVLAFSQGGAKVTGPPTAVAANFTGTVGQPVAISRLGGGSEGARSAGSAAGGVRACGQGSIATVSLHKFRGPGNVTFDKARIPVPKQGAMVTASATFSAPGEYLLRVQANDESGEGGFGFQCCWTNTYVKVTVR